MTSTHDTDADAPTGSGRRVTVVYESMYGNTHAIVDHIAAGFDDRFVVVVEPTSLADAAPPSSGLLIVGGPTHAHSLTSSSTRSAAIDAADTDEELHVDEHATDVGLRDWLDHLPDGMDLRTAAFDTRVDMSALLTGRASKGSRDDCTGAGTTWSTSP